MNSRSALTRIAMATWLLAAGLPAQAQLQPLTQEEAVCGALTVPNRVPPMDYRTDKKMLTTVEWGHFRPQVENLVKPMFDSFGADLDYTLHAYPNHPKALMTLIKLGDRQHTDQPKDMAYPIDCFFRRALRFRSDDHVVRMIYAQYLARHGREGDAMQQLDYVAVKATDSPLTLYNLALSYLELKANDKAWAQAKAAAELGVDLEKTELHARLVAAGAWRDPATEATAPSSPASASDKAAAAPGPARQ